jgi:hypothetical protein
MRCPKCGQVQDDALECQQCGLIFAKYKIPAVEGEKAASAVSESPKNVPAANPRKRGNPLLSVLRNLRQWPDHWNFHWPSVVIGLALGLILGIILMAAYSEVPLLPEERIVHVYRNAQQSWQTCLDSMTDRIVKEWEAQLKIKKEPVSGQDLPTGPFEIFPPTGRFEIVAPEMMLNELPRQVRSKICAKERDALEAAAEARALFDRRSRNAE